MTLPRRLLDEAAGRMLDVRAAPDDATLQAETRAWIDADHRNRRAWALAERAWIASGESLARPPRPANRNRRTFIAATAAAACVALAAPEIADRLAADIRAPSGAPIAHVLEDGSAITLAGDSAVSTAIGPDARRVGLLRGAAYFDVRADAGRAFVVSAAGLTVTVRGTAFDVAIGRDAVTVSVAHGAVAVADGETETVLHGGDRLDVRNADGHRDLARIAPEDVALWRRDRLAVADAPVGEVIDALRRRHGGIIIADAETRARRVTGVFDLADPARALAAVVAPHGDRAVELGGGIWWIRR